MGKFCALLMQDAKCLIRLPSCERALFFLSSAAVALTREVDLQVSINKIALHQETGLESLNFVSLNLVPKQPQRAGDSD